MRQILRRVNPVLVIGILLAVVASVATHRYVGQQRSLRTRRVVQPAPVSKAVIVAARNINAGQLVTSEMLRSSDVAHPAWTPEQKEMLLNIIGRVASRDIAAGEEVKAADFAPPETCRATSGQAFEVPPGLRALSVQTGSALAGQPELVRPGDQVDVIALTSQSGWTYSRTIVQNTPVLSVIEGGLPATPETPRESGVPSQGAARPAGPATVVLAVTPEQAEQIALAQMLGTIRLTVRNRMDHSRFASKGTDGTGVLWPRGRGRRELSTGTGEKRLPPPPASQPRPIWSAGLTPPQPAPRLSEPRATVEVIRGVERSLVEVRAK